VSIRDSKNRHLLGTLTVLPWPYLSLFIRGEDDSMEQQGYNRAFSPNSELNALRCAAQCQEDRFSNKGWIHLRRLNFVYLVGARPIH